MKSNVTSEKIQISNPDEILKKRYFQSPILHITFFGKKSFFAFLFCFIIFFLSFLFPLSQMLYWTIKFPENLFDIDVISLTLNTIYLVILSSIVLILFSLTHF